jgi:hypothetical protein
MNSLRRLLAGTADPLTQQIADYGAATALGIGGQQIANMVTGGSDPNPLISGALMAPSLALGLRGGRAVMADTPYGRKVNKTLMAEQLNNPYSQAALYGSAASMVGGGATNLLNTISSGDDIDPNNVAIGLGLLGGTFPIAASMMSANRPRVDTSFQPPNRAVGLGATSSGTYAYDSVDAPYSKYTGRPAWSGETGNAKNQSAPQRPVTIDLDAPWGDYVEQVKRASSSQPSSSPSIASNLPQGRRGGDLAVVPRNSVVTVPPLAPWDIASLEYDVRKRGFSTPMTQNKYPYESGLYKTYDAL